MTVQIGNNAKNKSEFTLRTLARKLQRVHQPPHTIFLTVQIIYQSNTHHNYLDNVSLNNRFANKFIIPTLPRNKTLNIFQGN